MPDAIIDWRTALDDNQRWMRTVVRSRIDDSHAVEDVLQEIAMAVLQQNSRPTDPCKVAPWLYRVAVRQTINYRRRRRQRRQLLENYANRCAEETSGDPRDWVLDEERRLTVAQAVKRIAPQHREILLLKYTEGWSYQDLAQHLGVSLKTIEYRLVKAKEVLRQQLRQVGYE